MRIYQHILPHGGKDIWQWLETVVMSLAALWFSTMLTPADPLDTHTFPWVWFVPLLIALRYGILMGSLSVSFFLAGWFVWFHATPALYNTFPKSSFLGGMLSVMISGEFSGLWIARIRRVNELKQYAEQRLEILTRRLFLLTLSHDRLEQDIIGRPSSLREGLKTLRQLHATENGLPNPSEFMALVMRQGNISSAGLYIVHDGRLDLQATASIGIISPLNPHDPIIKLCLDKKELIHINTQVQLSELPSHYLAAVPAVTSEQQLIAMLLIEKMPFFAFQAENLQALSVLTSYYADIIAANVLKPYLAPAIQDCPIEFFHAMYTLRKLQRNFQIKTSLVGYVVANTPSAEEQLGFIGNSVRALDESWVLVRKEWRICLILLPLTGGSSLTGYLDRIDSMFFERFGNHPGKMGIQIQSSNLEQDNIGDHLQTFILQLTTQHMELVT